MIKNDVNGFKNKQTREICEKMVSLCFDILKEKTMQMTVIIFSFYLETILLLKKSGYVMSITLKGKLALKTPVFTFV